MTAAATLTLAPDTSAIELEMNAIERRALAFSVVNQTDAEAASAFLREVKAVRGRVAATFDDLIQDAHKQHKRLIERKNEFDGPLTRAESTVKGKVQSWQREELRKAEQARREAEAAARAEAERLAAEARAAEEARRLSEAVALEAAGHAEAAEELLRAPVVVVPPPVVMAPAVMAPRVEGITFRQNWKARVTSMWALIQHVAAHPECANLLSANDTALNQLAKSLKENMRIPGVEAYDAGSTAVR